MIRVDCKGAGIVPLSKKHDRGKGAENLEKNDCKIDVIITHEPSSTIKGFLKLGESEAVRVTTLNAYFDELSKCSEFQRWFFGSLHLDKYISNTYIGVHKAIVNAHTGENSNITAHKNNSASAELFLCIIHLLFRIRV